MKSRNEIVLYSANKITTYVLSFLFVFTSLYLSAQIDTLNAVPGQWSVKKINKWYKKQPWLVGCNYYPATAINQIDMWQASTWDPKRIDLELGWAEDMGMNTLRVFLHDMVWQDDEEGLYQRMDEFLTICKNHGIRPWFVFFDDCHYPNPQLGPQPLPVRAFHNSGWVNCPARDLALRYANNEATTEEINQLKGYVQKTMTRFKDDDRILLWELYNEPGRGSNPDGDWVKKENPAKIKDKSSQLVYDSWVWAREVNPSQPITSTTDGSIGKMNFKINRINSDLHSIHVYLPPNHLRNQIKKFQMYGRPIIATEWLARTHNNTVENCLPILKEMKVGAINWGFVAGKSGTIWPWSSRTTAAGSNRSLSYEREIGNVETDPTLLPEPELWFHDLLRFDGTPYSEDEIKIFKELTKSNKK
ncbi:cellulase family glycosylhydrolase [Gaetbulibacter saemankumensis]|uniref:cellulase family glycosylhydrolase n=1 Tax=Gaetbulibacter saemankumensis TaxID=311208 RepID=UPI0004014BE7|nr:cellulase family glycosylhydrolase [Gaetbulibacter saemankumensis]